MKKIWVFMVVAILTGAPVVVVGTQSAYQQKVKTKGTTINKQLTSTKRSTKFEKFFRAVDRSGNLKDLARAFKEAKFSDAEIKQIKNELRKTRYDAKLNTLVKKAKAAAKSSRITQVRKNKTFLYQMKRKLSTKNQQKIRRLNQQTRLRRRSIKAEAKSFKRLRPITSQHPEITRRTPDSISGTGLAIEVLIEGRNFLTERPGTVQVRFRAPSDVSSIDLEIEDWADTEIYALFTDGGEGIPPGIATLVVRTHRGLEATIPISWEGPVRSIYVVNGIRNHRVQCEEWDYDGDAPTWLCLVGHRRTFNWGPEYPCNQYRVVDIRFEEVDGWGSNGYRVIHKSPTGATVIRYSVEVWADLYSWIEVSPKVYVEGPLGLDDCINPLR